MLARLALGFLVVLGGCAQLGVIGDGTSISWGRANRGGIIDPAWMPDDGDGHTTPQLWIHRGHRYATDELVDLLVGASRRVVASHAGPRLAVADLSPLRGGRSAQHQSHQSGRDADLLFFMTDDAGNAVDSVAMRRFNRDGVTIDDRDYGGQRMRFDVARNWALIKAMLTAPEADVQYVFIYEPLAVRLLDHARAIGEPESLLELARSAMMQPGDSAPHDDHLHVRIFCPVGDLAYGCVDRGSRPVPKKRNTGMAALPESMRTVLAAPMPAMLALVGRP